MDQGNPHPTIYLQNLNERVRPEDLKRTLTEWLSPCGKIEHVVAKKRLALRGQAWIRFDSVDSARRALEFIHGRRLYGKTVNVRFARYKSDAVAHSDGSYEAEKYHRDQERLERARHPRMTRRQILQQVMANPAMSAMSQPSGMVQSGMGVGAELQLPNKILYVQGVTGVGEEALNRAFQRFPGFGEVRLVPHRPDLAFVEYDSEVQAAAARNATDRLEIAPGAPLRVSYARR